MKNFNEIKKNCLLFADICAAYEIAAEAVEKDYERKMKNLLFDTNAKLCGISSEFNVISGECENEKRERSNCATHHLAEAKEIVDGINDGHFKRVKHRRLNESLDRTYLPNNYKTMNFDALRALIENSLAKLKEAAASLEDAFAPPLVSSAIGFVVPSFRKKLHCEIVTRHADIVRLAAVLNNFSLINSTAKSAAAGEKELHETIVLEANSCAAKYKKERSETLKMRRSTFKKVILADNVKKIFVQTDGKHYLGKYHYFSKLIGDVSDSLSGDAKALPGGGISFNTFAEKVEKLLLVSDKQTSFKNWFITLALDIIDNSAKARIRFFDLAKLGSSYSVLNPLLPVSDIAVARTPYEAHTFLSEAERYIADVNAGKCEPCDTYFFIENIPENISERDAELFLKIMRNGEKCGVHIIGSIIDGAAYKRAFCEIISEICTDGNFTRVEKCRINIGGGYLYLAIRENAEQRVKRLTKKLLSIKEKLSVIPIRKTFPSAKNFQNESSLNGITVPIGIDESGGTASLVFSEKRPYALIVGDVTSGKSSALHATLLGIMARYSPKEVQFAVGDFKNGCEFKTYADGGCKHFESVVSSEDTDTMASFLRYYVSRMNARQSEFDEVSLRGGASVRKYETYRQECTRLGLEYLPRIIIVIDEFQTLFDNGSSGTGALLSELVRKGRTYGIHILMASQRATSDNLKSSFGAELKNYFTTRIVFKCPVQVARTMLSETCADSGRANSGIAKAPLLECGHAVINTYMGQTEEGTSVMQCFYASGEFISEARDFFASFNKKKYVEFLCDSYKSLPHEDIVGYITLGKSTKLLNDSTIGGGDVICDDSLVALDLEKLHDSILVCGTKDFAKSFFTFTNKAFTNAKINICDYSADGFAKDICKNATIVNSVSELTVPTADEYTVNIIVSPERDALLHQSSSYREVPTAEHFKNILQSAESGKVINIVFVGDFKAVKNCMPYLADLAPLRFVSQENGDNVRAALGDVPFAAYQNNANRRIACYCNKKTGKIGRFFTFSLDII